MRGLARVMNVYAARAADVVHMETGQTLSRVPILAASASTDSGMWDIAAPAPAADANALAKPQPGRNLFAIVEQYGTQHVIMGFISPGKSDVQIKEPNRFVWKHPSGAYFTMAPDGSVELFHPFGGLIRIGTGGHQAPAAFANGGWTVPAGAAAPTITMTNGPSLFNMVVSPDGTVAITTPKPITMTYQTLTLNGPITINGAVQHNGSWTANGAGGTGNAVYTLTGMISVTQDVVAAGKSLVTHTHGGVQTGGGHTAIPD